jgi:hypothetical protein
MTNDVNVQLINEVDIGGQLSARTADASTDASA